MSAVDKTKNLQRVSLPIGLLEPNPENPNQMKDAEFNLLYDNLEKTGLTDPILVRKIGDKYRIVGGHHRWEVAKLHGFEEVPCTVITDPDFDDDQERFQLVRMNVIRGKMSPQKFLKLYQELAPKYTEDLMQDAFGFADEEEFKKLIKQTANALPKEMQAEFKKAAKEIKTIDGLSTLLNQMFTKYGTTLDQGYMVVDYGGAESVWIQISKATFRNVLDIGELCRERGVTMDVLLGGVLQLIADGTIVLDTTDLQTVSIPDTMDALPTIENLKEAHG